MSLEHQITLKLKEAMKLKDSLALESLRAIKSELLLIKTKNKEGTISEEEELKILQRLVKQRRDSAEIYFQKNRKDLAETELSQCTVIEQFLPEQLSEIEVSKIIQSIIKNKNAKSMKDMGLIMGLATKQLAGKAEGKIISKIVKSQLSQNL